MDTAAAIRTLRTAPSLQPPSPGRSALEVVRQLVAERAELPLTAVQENDQLLQDLHFSSIAVGSVVADAARAGLAAAGLPTDYARAPSANWPRRWTNWLARAVRPRDADRNRAAAASIPGFAISLSSLSNSR